MEARLVFLDPIACFRASFIISIQLLSRRSEFRGEVEFLKVWLTRGHGVSLRFEEVLTARRKGHPMVEWSLLGITTAIDCWVIHHGVFVLGLAFGNTI